MQKKNLAERSCLAKTLVQSPAAPVRLDGKCAQVGFKSLIMSQWNGKSNFISSVQRLETPFLPWCSKGADA